MLTRDGAAVGLAVEPDGPGIPESDRARGLEPFVCPQVSDQRQSGPPRIRGDLALDQPGRLDPKPKTCQKPEKGCRVSANSNVLRRMVVRRDPIACGVLQAE